MLSASVCLNQLSSLLSLLLSFSLFGKECFAVIKFPIGSNLDRALPTLGKPNDYLPSFIQSRGFWDPQAQILCVGEHLKGGIRNELLPENYPVQRWSWQRPNYRTTYGTSLRSICAKVAYGGVTTAWTAGAYCAYKANPPTVVFEKLPPPGGMTREIEEVFLYCQHACRCVEGTQHELLVQGRPANVIRETEAVEHVVVHSDPEHYPISQPIPPRAQLHNEDPPLRAGSDEHIPIYFLPEIDARILNPRSSEPQTKMVSTLWIPPPSKVWAPKCSGEMEFDNFGETASAQEMCAADWYGGSARGNLGLACTVDEDYQDEIRAISQQPVAHPVYLKSQWLEGSVPTKYDLIARQCDRRCICEPPEPENKPVPQETVLREGIFDAAQDFIMGICRVGRIDKAISSFCSSGQWGSSRGARYRTMNSNLRRDYMCRTQQVDGFDLSGSIAATALCNDRYGQYNGAITQSSALGG